MNSDLTQEVFKRLDSIEKRLQSLEKPSNPNDDYIDLSDSIKSREIPSRSIPLRRRPPVSPQRRQQPQGPSKNQFLGYIGVACLILASILLIKLSIDSGWLTPLRQLMLASALGVSLIFIPFENFFNDKEYLSMLPAVGIVVLHLTVYGGVFYHELIAMKLGLLCISLVSFLSLWLLAKLDEETFAALAIIGTYVGAFFFKDAFNQLIAMGAYLMIWNISFSLFAVTLKRRSIITIASYFALGLIAIFGLHKGGQTHETTVALLVLQGIQFLTFCFATAYYSIKNESPLTNDEAWLFFPVIVFFYGQEYYFLDQISDKYATVFAVVFAAFLFTVYKKSAEKLQEKSLDSSGVVYTACFLIFAHSIFLSQFNDMMRVIFSFLLLAGAFKAKDLLEDERALRGCFLIGFLMLIYSFLIVLFGTTGLGQLALLVFGVLFGVIALIGTAGERTSYSSLILYMGHAQIFMVIYRLRDYIGEFLVSPLWVAYAFVILYWSSLRSDKEMAASAVPLIIIALARFLFFEFSNYNSVERVVALLTMGGLIFAGGYLYKKVANT